VAAPSAPPAAPSIEEDWSQVDFAATPGPSLEEAPHAASAIRGGLPRPIALE